MVAAPKRPQWRVSVPSQKKQQLLRVHLTEVFLSEHRPQSRGCYITSHAEKYWYLGDRPNTYARAGNLRSFEHAQHEAERGSWTLTHQHVPHANDKLQVAQPVRLCLYHFYPWVVFHTIFDTLYGQLYMNIVSSHFSAYIT
jgi:hypothetical protein